MLSSYTRSKFQDFESFLRTEVDLVEDDIKLVLDEYNSSFISSELQPGIYRFKDLSQFLLTFLQPEYPGATNTNDIKFDDIGRKTKLIVNSGIIAKRFDDKWFFSSVFFVSGWDYKHYDKYIS